MNSENRHHLQTPRGTEAFDHDDAYRHRIILRLTEDHFSSWGYMPVLTPVFDYYETYRDLLNKTQTEHSYRFPDRDGELVMLRSDITLFLAKQMGQIHKKSSEPRRVYYADSILRHQDEENISNDEFFQSGAEFIGSSGENSDLEVLMLLHDLLHKLQLPLWRMHIGSRDILRAIICTANEPLEDRVGHLLELRDETALMALLGNAGLPEPEARSRLLLFLGTAQEFTTQQRTLVNACGEYNRDNIVSAVHEFSSLINALTCIAPSENIRVDLSEHGNQPYYTGFTVRAYMEGVSAAVASGGRYDSLLSQFGYGAPAAGFSLMMRKIEPLSAYNSPLFGKNTMFKAVGNSFNERYTNAVQRREQGNRVVLS